MAGLPPGAHAHALQHAVDDETGAHALHTWWTHRHPLSCMCCWPGRDQWVRVRTGLYKDDLAKVVDVDFAAQKATIRLLPRLDFVAMANRVSIMCMIWPIAATA